MRGSGPLGEPIRIPRCERVRAPCAVKRRLAPAGTAIPRARHQIGNQTFSRCERPALDRESQAQGRLSAVPPRPPNPHPQPCPPGPLTAWPGLPGAAARPGRVVRALSLGRKRKRADGRGALARRLLCGDLRLRAPGVGAAGAGSARLTSLAPSVPAAAALRAPRRPK